LFLVVALLGIETVWGAQPFLGRALCFAVLYVWSKKEMDNAYNYWGFTLKAY
jgi:hypothetical protein